MDWTSVGKRIRTKRELLGYSRERFAELLDITPKFCSDIELGIKGMSIPTLCKIADVLTLSTDYILFGSDVHSPLSEMIQRCPKEKQKYLELIIRTYIQAVEPS